MAAVTALAQPYPARPVTVITSGVPFGLTDISARLVALQGHRYARSAGRRAEPRGGGRHGRRGAAVARAAPDGHTLLVVDDSHAVNPHLFRNISVRRARGDFAPVSLLARAPLVLVVNSHVPARTVAELAQLAKAKPGLVTFADDGTRARRRGS